MLRLLEAKETIELVLPRAEAVAMTSVGCFFLAFLGPKANIVVVFTKNFCLQ